RKDDQWLTELTDHLATQQMEDLRPVRRLYGLNVVVGTKLQEAFNACRGMFGTLSFVAMREHQSQATMTAPLCFARGDELINNHLRAVGEVTKLRFPDG